MPIFDLVIDGKSVIGSIAAPAMIWRISSPSIGRDAPGWSSPTASWTRVHESMSDVLSGMIAASVVFQL